MADDVFASHAWLMKGMTGSEPGWLALREGRLCFATAGEVLFDVPRSEVGSVTFPWYYFGGGVKLSAAGEKYRFSFVKPNGSEYAEIRASPTGQDPRAVLGLVMSKASDISEGRDATRQWRRILAGGGS